LKEKRERERERIERGGARWEKGEVWGVFGQTAIPFLPSIQNRWRGNRPGGRPAGAPAGGPVHGGVWRMGENGEEAEGFDSPTYLGL
jgi:hypothetical protein